MRRFLTIAAAAACLVSFSDAIDIRGTVSPSTILPLSPDSKVILDGGLSGSTFVKADGSFLLRNVPAGQYVLGVQNREYSFPSVAVTVPTNPSAGQAAEAVQVRSFKLGHASASPDTVPLQPYPIILHTTGRREYFEEPKSFSLTTLLQQNKMILLMVLGLAFAIGMPKLLAYIDPEALKEVQQNQAEMHKNLGMAQNMDISGSLSKFLAGGSAAPASAPAEPSNKRTGKKKAQ